MTIKELVTELNKISAEFGDNLDVIIASNKEGKKYSSTDSRLLSVIDKKAGDNKLEAIGIVIYPASGFEKAQDACRKV